MEPTFPVEEGPGLELREENRGLKVFQGCDRDTWPERQEPWRPWNCPGHLPKTVPPARAAVLLTQGLLQGPVLGNYAAQVAIVKDMTGRNRAAQLEIVKQMSRQ